MKNFSVKIPAGIRNDEKIRLIGQGKKGENGGKNGDLLIKINIEKNKKFRLEGCTLYTDLNLTPWEAALGARINVEGIDGQETVYIPKGIESGEKIRIQGKGYKDGKCILQTINVFIPNRILASNCALSDAQLEELYKAGGFKQKKTIKKFKKEHACGTFKLKNQNWVQIK